MIAWNLLVSVAIVGANIVDKVIEWRVEKGSKHLAIDDICCIRQVRVTHLSFNLSFSLCRVASRIFFFSKFFSRASVRSTPV